MLIPLAAGSVMCESDPRIFFLRFAAVHPHLIWSFMCVRRDNTAQCVGIPSQHFLLVHDHLTAAISSGEEKLVKLDVIKLTCESLSQGVVVDLARNCRTDKLI